MSRAYRENATLMRGALLAPLSVGIVRSSTGQPAALVVKASYELVEGKSAQLTTVPEPISVDRHDDYPATELRYASDFEVPKPSVDVLVVGHARSARPSSMIAVGVTLGNLVIKVDAISSEPRLAIPLHSQSLVARSGEGARLAPSTGRSGPNVAPVAHRLARYKPGARMSFVGLFRDGSGAMIRLPKAEPRAWFGVREARMPVSLACDTIWIDVDAARLVLVWRGAVASTTPDEAYVIASLGGSAQPPSHQTLLQRPDSAIWTEVAEEPGRKPGPQEQVLPRVWQDDDDDDDDDDRKATTVLATSAEQRTAAIRAAMAAAEAKASASQDTEQEGESTTSQGTLMIDTAGKLDPVLMEQLAKAAGLDGDSTMVVDEADPSAPVPFGTVGAAAPAPLSSDELDAWHDDLGGSTQIREPQAPPSGPAPVVEASQPQRTAEFNVAEHLGALASLPFDQVAPASRPRSLSPVEMHGFEVEGGKTKSTSGEHLLSQITGYGDGPSEEPLPIPPPRPRQNTQSGLGHGSLPLPPSRAPSVPALSPMAPWRPPPLAAPPAAPPPAAPPPAAPRPRASSPSQPGASPRIDLHTYAHIKAALWDKRAPLEQLLAEQGLDLITWRKHEREQTMRVAKDATQGSGALAKSIQVAIRQARQQASQSSDLSVDDYAQLFVRCENPAQRDGALQREGMNAGDWDMLQRKWQRRAQADPDVAASLDRAINRARIGS
jgi:Uncharacterized protein conserved in bacteria (DUF2169)